MTRDEKLALALFLLIVGMGFVAILAFKGWQHAAWERDRTCTMALASLTEPSHTLFRQSAPWCAR